MRNKIVFIFFYLIFCQACDRTTEAVTLASNVEFSSKSYDFGVISMRDTVDYTFKIENLSDQDLILKGVESSCSCTITYFTKEPIKKNQTAKIRVEFIPFEKGTFNKSVVLYANTKPKFTVLSLNGVVEEY